MTSAPDPAPNLQHVATLRAYISPEVVNVGSRSTEHDRFIAPVIGGFFKLTTKDIEAEIIPPGADWPIADSSTGHAYLDVRLRAKTTEGELYIQYTGVLKMNEAATKAFSGAHDAKSTNFGDASWFTRLTVETSDTRLKWLETSLLVGQGRWHVDETGTAAEYMVYKLC
ncbi:hypothetical protein H2200_002869 [Cladophialophora chaetospira]|uniref:Uncharacterized protein n=1 Tax=Cladophialophora chaetospira TaxID=386627 RepID=A0AA38XG98_9EURO|nr:hypothetical protein H2200_002869 [Cladophialophora chaetospira]